MCFSAEASFTAAAVLVCLGVMTLRAAPSIRYGLLASMPLAFGIQQFSEGMLWLIFQGTIQSSGIEQLFKTFFIFMGMCWWPVVTPLSVWLIEEERGRRYIMAGFLVLGLYIAGKNFSTLVEGVPVERMAHSLRYDAGDGLLERLFYALAIIPPFLLSTLKGIKWIGFLFALAFIVSEIFYSAAFISVWCFFSALLSVLIYFVLKRAKASESP